MYVILHVRYTCKWIITYTCKSIWHGIVSIVSTIGLWKDDKTKTTLERSEVENHGRESEVTGCFAAPIVAPVTVVLPVTWSAWRCTRSSVNCTLDQNSSGIRTIERKAVIKSNKRTNERTRKQTSRHGSVKAAILRFKVILFSWYFSRGGFKKSSYKVEFGEHYISKIHQCLPYPN